MNCSDVHAMFNVSQPTVSHHLKELAIAGILDKEKQGQFCFYQVRVVQESAKNYRSFLNKKKNLTEKRSIISTLRKLFAEELEPNKQHPHSADTAGLN